MEVKGQFFFLKIVNQYVAFMQVVHETHTIILDADTNIFPDAHKALKSLIKKEFYKSVEIVVSPYKGMKRFVICAPYNWTCMWVDLQTMITEWLQPMLSFWHESCPIAPVHKSTRSKYTVICPYCGKVHKHQIILNDDGVRVADCGEGEYRAIKQ